MCSLDRGLRRALTAFATSGPERCGLLFGERGPSAFTVRAVEELDNNSASIRRFELDPVRMAEAARRKRSEGLELLGAWHTHPDSCTALSELDLAGAFGGQLSIVVGAGGELQAFEHTDSGTAVELSLARSARAQARRPK